MLYIKVCVHVYVFPGQGPQFSVNSQICLFSKRTQKEVEILAQKLFRWLRQEKICQKKSFGPSHSRIQPAEDPQMFSCPLQAFHINDIHLYSE